MRMPKWLLDLIGPAGGRGPSAPMAEYRAELSPQLTIARLEERLVLTTAPVANDDPGNVTQIGTQVAITVLANDTDAEGNNTIDASSVSIVNGQGPSNGTTQVLGNGVIRYTPTGGFTGTDSFQYTVEDEDGNVSNAATVTVRGERPAHGGGRWGIRDAVPNSDSDQRVGE